MPPYFQFTFDGMRTLFMAISNTLHRGVDKSDIKGENLRKDIFDLKFEGISGPIGFDENGDRLSPYAIMNNQVTSRRLLSTTHPRSRQLSGTPTFVNLGVYDGSSDSITLTKPFRFTDGSTTAPADRPAACLKGNEYAPAARKCIACPRGMYNPEVDSDCGDCPVGAYGLNPGAESIAECFTSPPGKYTGHLSGQTSNSSCKDCPTDRALTYALGKTACSILW